MEFQHRCYDHLCFQIGEILKISEATSGMEVLLGRHIAYVTLNKSLHVCNQVKEYLFKKVSNIVTANVTDKWI